MTKLGKINLVFYSLLLLWFTFDLIGIPGFVTRDNLFSLSGVWELILIAVLIGYLLKWKYNDFFSGLVVAVWGYLQYDSHWRAFLFGASDEWLRGYYRFFAGMYRFIPESPIRAIPDAYHTILGLLIAVNFVLIVIKIIFFFKSFKRC